MAEYIFIDKKLYPASQAKIPVEDRGLLFGDGIYETMRSYHGKVFMLDAHIERLMHSLKVLKFNLAFDRKYLVESLRKTIDKNGLSEADAYIKIIVTRGVHRSRLYLDYECRPALIIIARKLHPYRQELYRNGAAVVTCSIKRAATGNSIYIHKSLCYLENLIAKDEANISGALEGIFITGDRKVLEGASSNIFMVRDSTVYTPPLRYNILPGITRQAVLQICGKNRIRTREQPVNYSDLEGADEVFLTSSIMEIMPVRKVDMIEIGHPVPGKMTSRLMELFRDFTGKSGTP